MRPIEYTVCAEGASRDTRDGPLVSVECDLVGEVMWGVNRFDDDTCLHIPNNKQVLGCNMSVNSDMDMENGPKKWIHSLVAGAGQ